MRFSSVRRLSRPVRPSVVACSSVLAKARTVPMRMPVWRDSVTSWRCTSGPGGRPTGPVACSTPSERPMNEIGTHTAEQAPPGRPRSLWQAFRASLVSNVVVTPLRTATQLNGETTPQPGAPAVGLTAARSRWARLESANNSSIGAPGSIFSNACSTMRRTSSSASTISIASPSWRPKSARLASPSIWTSSDVRLSATSSKAAPSRPSSSWPATWARADRCPPATAAAASPMRRRTRRIERDRSSEAASSSRQARPAARVMRSRAVARVS